MSAPKTEGPIKCTWHLGTTEKSPHQHERPKEGKILNSILEHIGDTPLVRLARLAAEEGVTCELLAKCEYFNAGGSVKDRIGRRMVEDAERSGRIKKGDILIEPTSGNTGIGLALAAAVKGYKMIITLPEKMSQEKVDVLKGLGAQIIRTPTEAAWDSPESHIGVALKLNKELPNSHILDQYANPSNPLAHYDGTGEEILEQCGGNVDMVVITAGTGGTLTGIARKIKERNPNCKIVAVDPVGSILATPASLNGAITSYKVEGIGYDFIPTVLDRSEQLVDKWYKTQDKESFVMARRLIRKEGLLCGGSSGSAMVAALQAIKDFKLGPGQKCVVILPDSVRNYMSKFLNDKWMIDNGFLDVETQEKKEKEEMDFGEATIADLKLPDAITVPHSSKCSEVISLLTSKGIDQVPVLDEKKQMIGYVTIGQLYSKIGSKRASAEDPVTSVMLKFDTKHPFHEITASTKLKALTPFFEKYACAFVTSKDAENQSVITKVVTKVDLLQYFVHRS